MDLEQFISQMKNAVIKDLFIDDAEHLHIILKNGAHISVVGIKELSLRYDDEVVV